MKQETIDGIRKASSDKLAGVSDADIELYWKDSFIEAIVNLRIAAKELRKSLKKAFEGVSK